LNAERTPPRRHEQVRPLASAFVGRGAGFAACGIAWDERPGTHPETLKRECGSAAWLSVLGPDLSVFARGPWERERRLAGALSQSIVGVLPLTSQFCEQPHGEEAGEGLGKRGGGLGRALV